MEFMVKKRQLFTRTSKSEKTKMKLECWLTTLKKRYQSDSDDNHDLIIIADILFQAEF